MEILFCGICHSDLHQVRNEWKNFMPTVYPCVPGHGIVGRVTICTSCSVGSRRVATVPEASGDVALAAE
jgi:D-arabinose 1-dehydrogenase-like Zn-dependent alcohol dehydrogenase